MTTLKHLLLSLAGLALLAQAAPAFSQSDESAEAAQKRFLERKSEGWFWYRDPKDAPAKKPEPPPSAQAAAPAGSAPKKPEEPFSVEWLRRSMPVLLDKAINDPTKDNVEAYMYAQRVAMDKSQRYAEMTRTVVSSDPFLDENNRVPLASYAKPFFLRKQQEGVDEAMKHLAGVGGLWVFFDSKCAFCKPQVYSVQEMSKKYGFVTKFISMDGAGLPGLPEFVKDNGHAKLLNLRITPTTVLVVPPNNYFVVSQGMMAQDQLADRLVVAADSNNLLPKDIATKVRSYDRGVLTPDDTKKGAGDDPAEWVKYLKDRLQGHY
jgi:conjugal transfer pilus assembly protein TraF